MSCSINPKENKNPISRKTINDGLSKFSTLAEQGSLEDAVKGSYTGEVRKHFERAEWYDLLEEAIQTDEVQITDFKGEIDALIQKNFDVAPDDYFSDLDLLSVGQGDTLSFMPWSASDFEDFLQALAGKGKEGLAQLKRLNELVYTPYQQGWQNWIGGKSRMYETFEAAKSKIDSDLLFQTTKDSNLTREQALRLYIWDQTGQLPENVSEAELQQANKYMEGDKVLQGFAEDLINLTGTEYGYVAPHKYWADGSIASDLYKFVEVDLKREYLRDFIDVTNKVFTEDTYRKLAKIKGRNYAKNLKKQVASMRGDQFFEKFGDAGVFFKWVNQQNAITLFFNTGAAIRQATLSTINYMDLQDNNPIAFAKAVANVPQISKDFKHIFFSDYGNHRRRSNGIDLSASELQVIKEFEFNNGTYNDLVTRLANLGYEPSLYADSIAISFGGATLYRNTINALMKAGATKEEAEAQAMFDVIEKTEKTQQSTREDRTSAEQKEVFGKFILGFANTNSQYNREALRAMSDIVSGRSAAKGAAQFANDFTKILNYALIQNMLYSVWVNGLHWYALADHGDDSEDAKLKKFRTINTVLDGIMRGMGKRMAIIKGALNFGYAIHQFRQGDISDVKVLEAAFSPGPGLNTKLRLIAKAMYELESDKYRPHPYNKLDLFSSEAKALGTLGTAVFNLPTAEIIAKIDVIHSMLYDYNEAWQNIGLAFGESGYALGIQYKYNRSQIEQIKANDPSLWSKLEAQRKKDIEKYIEIRKRDRIKGYEKKKRKIDKLIK